MRNSLLIFAGLLAILAIGFGVWKYAELLPSAENKPTGPRPTLVSAQRAFTNGDYESSLAIATELLEDDPNSPRAAIVAGESATKLGKLDAALDFYASVSDTAEEAPTARWAAGEILFYQGRVSESRNRLQECLSLDPGQLNAHQRFIDVGTAVGLRREVQPSIMTIVRSGQVQANLLLLLGNLEKDTWTEESLNRFRKAAPSDPLPDLGFARIHIKNGNFEDAVAQLRKLIEKMPELIEAHVQLGYALLESQPDQLHDWNEQLPASAENHPGTWYVRGQWLKRLGKSQEHAPGQAIRCFLEAARLDPNHLPAHQSVAQLLKAKGKDEVANAFAERAESLQKMNIALEQVYLRRGDTELMREIVELSRALGRVWECVGWCGVARSVNPSLTWPDAAATEMLQGLTLSAQTPQTLPSSNLATESLIASFALPDFATLALRNTSSQPDSSVGEYNRLFMEDRSEPIGLDFTYICNNLEGHDGRRMHEITGGGVGIIDFDKDGFQDLFLTQGGVFPILKQGQPNSELHQDALFKTLSAGEASVQDENKPNDMLLPTVKRVDKFARLSDFDYGQGVAVGDLNHDGFDDLFVCNVGQNRLWINCGDGTFVDRTRTLPADTKWSVSAGIADLNNDGNPEIYEANYVKGEDVHSKMCEMQGKLRSCSPLSFTPTDDRILYNDGQGGFELVDAPDMNAPSLGVLIFKMLEEKSPSIFVAVDQAANLLGKIELQDDSDGVPFTVYDEALITGIAYDSAGEAQACMGIASGDANNDGALDFYVSNFYLEYYTLYLQEAGLFNDATSGSDTIADTRPLLGFGTQFFDGDLDGNEDLLVVNGHIDDHSHVGVPETMPSLLYAGNGQGQFSLQAAKGNFLSRRQLGRALAKVDLDRDGRMDMICGDLENATTYIRNESEVVGKPLTIHLVGTESDRNAYCAIATLSTSTPDGKEYRRTKQQVGGCGFQASNERCLDFSLPNKVEDETEVLLEIEWPSGHKDRYSLDASAASYIAVEHAGINRIHDYAAASLK